MVLVGILWAAALLGPCCSLCSQIQDHFVELKSDIDFYLKKGSLPASILISKPEGGPAGVSADKALLEDGVRSAEGPQVGAATAISQGNHISEAFLSSDVIAAKKLAIHAVKQCTEVAIASA